MHINNVRYADDTVLIATSLEDLQKLLDKVNSTSQDFGHLIEIDFISTTL